LISKSKFSANQQQKLTETSQLLAYLWYFNQSCL